MPAEFAVVVVAFKYSPVLEYAESDAVEYLALFIPSDCFWRSLVFCFAIAFSIDFLDAFYQMPSVLVLNVNAFLLVLWI